MTGGLENVTGSFNIGGIRREQMMWNLGVKRCFDMCLGLYSVSFPKKVLADCCKTYVFSDQALTPQLVSDYAKEQRRSERYGPP